MCFCKMIEYVTKLSDMPLCMNGGEIDKFRPAQIPHHGHLERGTDQSKVIISGAFFNAVKIRAQGFDNEIFILMFI